MSLARMARFIGALVVSLIALPLILPLLGVPQSRFLPPSLAYAKAQGKTMGVVTHMHHEQTDNPFHVGDQLYFIDYQFQARPTVHGVPAKEAQTYKGMIRVQKDFWDNADKGSAAPVKYDLINPGLNGVDVPGGGLSVIGDSAFMSGWLLWVGVLLILTFVLTAIFNRFGASEDI